MAVRRRIKIVMGTALAGIILVLACGVLLLYSNRGKSWVLDKLIALLAADGVHLTAEGINYNLAEGRVTLLRPVMSAADARRLPPVLSADKITVDVSVRELFRGVYWIESAAVTGPELHIVVQENGTDNIPDFPSRTGSKSSGQSFFIDEARVSSARIAFDDQARNAHVTLSGVEATVDGDPRTRAHDLSIRAGSGVVRARKVDIPVTFFSALLYAKDETIKIKEAQIESGASQLRLTGTVDTAGASTLDLHAVGDLQLALLEGLLPARARVDGAIGVVADVSGPVSDLNARAILRGEDLRIAEVKDIDVKADIVVKGLRGPIHIEGVEIDSPVLTSSASGSISLVGGNSSKLVLNIQRADLGKLSRIFDLPVRIASVGSGKVTATAPGLDLERLDATANLRLRKTRSVPAEDVLPVTGAFDLSIQGERVRADVRSLQTLGADVSGDLLLRGRQIQGNLSGTVQLGSALIAAQRYRGNNAQPPADVEGEAKIQVALSGTIQKPDVTTDINASDLRVGSLEGLSVSGNARYANGQVAVQDANIKWRDQELTASGSIGTEGRKALDLQVKSHRIALDAILDAAGLPDVPVKGTIDLSGRLHGSASRPEGAFEVQGTNLTVYGQTLETLTANAKLEDSRVILEQARATNASGDVVQLSGAFDRESKQLQLLANTSDFQLRNVRLPNGTELQANLTVRADVSGTRSSPQGAIEIAAADVSIGGEPLGRVTADVKLQGGRALFEAAVPHFNARAEGAVELNEPYSSRIQARLDGTDLGSVPLKALDAVQGSVTASLQFAGPLQRPELGRADIRMEPLDLTVRGQAVQTRGPIVAGYANKALSLDKVTIVAAGSELQVSGSVPLEPAGSAGVLRLAGTVDLAAAAALAPSAGVEARGTATIDGSIRGTLRQPVPNLTVITSNAAIEMPGMNPITDITARVEVKDGVLVESVAAKWAGGRIASSGTIPLSFFASGRTLQLPAADRLAELTADITGVHLSFMEKVPNRLEGLLTAHLDVQAERPALEAVTGTLRFEQLDLRAGDITVSQVGPSTINVRDAVARFAQFELAGPTTKLVIDGTVALDTPHGLAVSATGVTDVALLAALSNDVRAEGPLRLTVSATGTLKAPRLNGTVELSDAAIAMSKPRLGTEDLDARLVLEGNRITIAQLNGLLNGGPLSGSGYVSLRNGTIADANIALKASEVYVEYPKGFKTLSDLAISIGRKEGDFVIGGRVGIREGTYSDPLTLDRGLMRLLESRDGGSDPVVSSRNPMLSNTRFDLEIQTINPLIVDNNLAQLGATADLRLVGRVYDPGLVGRVTLDEGGELYLSERRYFIDRGVITFTNERDIQPELDIVARTEAAGYDISMLIEGGGGERIETTLTSVPSLPEPDIIAVLLTGRKLEEIRGAELDVAKEQLLSFLAGSITGNLTGRLQQLTGLTQIRLEPNLIAAETDPTARLTVGQDITKDLSLIYSMDLTNSNDQIYIAEYDLSRRFSTRAVRQQDNSYRFEFRHDLVFGGGQSSRSRREDRVRRLVAGVDLIGESPLPRQRLADKFDVEQGDKYDFFEVRRGLDRLRKAHHEAGYLESRVRLDRSDTPQGVSITVSVQAGPALQFVFEGWSAPDDVRERVRKIWEDGVFDTQRLEETTTALKSALARAGYLQPTIRATVADERSDKKRVVFDIQPGIRYSDVRLVFAGADKMERDRLEDAIDEADLEEAVYLQPERVTELLTALYRKRGFLDASVQAPRYELDPARATGRIVFPINEGPRYEVGDLQFAGNDAVAAADLREALRIESGAQYTPELRATAVDRLTEAYNSLGYLDANVTASTTTRSGEAKIDVTFKIEENRRSVLAGIDILGNDSTSRNLIRTQLAVKTGAPISYSSLSKSRRNLYRTGAFRIVDLEREVLNPDAADSKQVRLKVEVDEIEPFELKYGGYYDTDRGPGGVVDLSNRLSLGSARIIGARARYDGRFREGRLYFSQPLLERFPLKTVASTYYTREMLETFNTDRRGISIQQETRFGDFFIVDYGYRHERVHTYDRNPDPSKPFDRRLRIAPLVATLSRETRDEILDATEGSFLSQAFQWAPELLGSQQRFVRYFGQYFKYVPLSEPEELPLSTGVFKPRLVYAGAVRIGVAGGVGNQDLIRTERFFAGGGTSIRGFRQNYLGPRDAGGEPVGGNAMLVVNNEVRFPLYWIFDGVAFADVGNVFPRASDLSLTDLRKTGGLGLRLRTPWFLLRLDYGVKLDRRPGEPRGAVFFSLGQAF